MMRYGPSPTGLHVVDAHMHLWDPAVLTYQWLAQPKISFAGDAAKLPQPYGLAEYRRDAAFAAVPVHVHKIVHIEANADDPMAETAWLQRLAKTDPAGMPNAIVAAADLTGPHVGDALARQATYANVRGIRQILNRHVDAHFRYVERDYLNDPAWQRGFGWLARHHLSFDLQLYPTQMADAVRLARRHPDTLLILNHAGMFVARGSVAGYRLWRDGLRALAACDNVCIKLSGLVMVDHAWTVESLRPYVLKAIDLFGPARCLFASNFPVDGLHATYGAVWRTWAEIVVGASADEQHALFGGNAERVYRL